jgi:hypothetical protein
MVIPDARSLGHLLRKDTKKEAWWATNVKSIGVGLPKPRKVTSQHHVPQMPDTGFQDLRFTRLVFGFGVVSSFLAVFLFLTVPWNVESMSFSS